MIIDPYIKQNFCVSTLRGWRATLINTIKFETNSWDDDIAKQFVIMEVLKSAKDKPEGIKFLASAEILSRMEIHFWASKFLLEQTHARKAWRAFYR